MGDVVHIWTNQRGLQIADQEPTHKMDNGSCTGENTSANNTLVFDSFSTATEPVNLQLNADVCSVIKMEDTEDVESQAPCSAREEGILAPRTKMLGSSYTIGLTLTAEDLIRWCQLKQEKDLGDTQLARFLLHHYGSDREHPICASCKSPLSRFCPSCFELSPDVQHKPILMDGTTSNNIENEDEAHASELPPDCEDQNWLPQAQVKDVPEKEDGDGRISEEAGGDEQCMQHLDSGHRTVDEEQEGIPVAECAWCDIPFTSIEAFDRHLTVHTTHQWQLLHHPGSGKSHHSTRTVRYSKRLTGNGSSVQSAGVCSSSVQTESKHFRCLFCKGMLKKVSDFTKHLQRHLKTNAFKCSQCEKTLSSLKQLKLHIKHHCSDSVERRPHQCRICGLRFTHLRFLANHVKKHIEPNPFWCARCQQGFASVSELTTHPCREGIEMEDTEHAAIVQDFSCDGISLEQIQGDDGGACPLDIVQQSVEKAERHIHSDQDSPASCQDELPTQAEDSTNETNAQQHRKQVERRVKIVKDQRHKCPECPATFKHLSWLKIHRQKHTGQNAFPCSLCESSFVSKRQLLLHQERDHWGSAPITCQDCGKVLKSVLSLEQHMVLHTGERPYPCNFCGESFRSQTALSVHRRTHNPDPFKCRQCSAKFLDPASYKVHMDSHGGEKPHLCSVCGDAFVQRYQLNHHMLRHGKKQYVCEHCGSAFFTRFEHKVHVMRHLGIKPFTCDLCNKSFVSKQKLNQHHISIHLRTKPYKCSQCDKAYSDVFRRNEHVRAVHTNERPFTCPVCGKGFAKSGCRQAHLRIHKRRKELT